MDKIITYSIPFFLISLLLEIFFSARLKKGFFYTKDTLGDLGTGILNQLISFFSKSWLFIGYAWFYNSVNIDHYLHLDFWTTDLASWKGQVSWGLGFILVDFVYYFFHRHSHEFNLLWATHIVHHSSEEYNLAVAMRQSSFSFIFNIIYSLSLAIVGVPPEIFFVSYAVNLVYQFWIHTRFIPKLGLIELIFNTPSHHRVHHARQEKYLDCNYAGVFIIWDRVFKTFIEEKDEPRYGVYPRFQSYDPVKANLYPLRELGTHFIQARGLNKLKVLFGGPLWTYETFKKGKKLDIRDNGVAPDFLSLALFFLALAMALMVLFKPTLDLWSQIAFTSMAVLNLKIMGIRLDSADSKRSLDRQD